MKYPTIRKNIMPLLIVFLFFSCGKGEKEQKIVNDQKESPNVLLIIGDDHGYADLSAAGLASDVQTPNIDRLASQGVRFTNAYASSPICSPSRVALLTGAYHQRQKVFWYGGNGISDPSIPTIAEWLGREDYATGMVGKFHYGSLDAKTATRSFPLNHGFDELFGCNGGRKHYLIHNNEKEKAFRKKMEKAADPKQGLEMAGFWQQDERVNVEGFSTELLGEKALDFLDRKKQEGNPFFLTLSFNAVHNFTHQLPESYLKEQGLKGYHDWDPEKEAYYDWYNQGRYPNNPEGRAHYLGQLHYLDKEIGKVMDHLDKSGLRENTIVIYVGDNGGSTQIYANNAPFSGGKYTMYEGGLRVPLIISWPANYEQGKTSEKMVSAMDIFPTICEALSLTIPETVDGKGLHTLLKGENYESEHEALFWYGGEQTAVRFGKWKYRWANNEEGSFARSSSKYEGVALELGEYLYDIEADPGETTNLASEHPEVVSDIIQKVEEWKGSVGII